MRNGSPTHGWTSRVTFGTLPRMNDQRISFNVGMGGWTRVGWDSRQALVRFELNPDGKTWRIADVWMRDPSRDVLRSLPLSRIENAANANAVVVLGLAIGRTAEVPADPWTMFAGAPEPVPYDRLRLERPKGKQLDADFYKRVAIAYRGALADGENPRQTLARDSGAAPDTVARWIREARRRGYLSKTEPGKVSV